MIGDILNSSKDTWAQKVSDAQNAVDNTNAERSTAASARDEANDRLKEQQVVVANCSSQVQQHADMETAAQRDLEAAEKEVRDFEDVQKGKAKKLEERRSIYKDNFEAVRSPDAPLSAKDQKMHLGKLTPVLKQLSADTSLLTVIQSVIKRMPAERGSFDSMALEQV